MLNSAKILVVDDEKIIREGCSRLLRKDGHEVTTARDGREALNLIDREHFDMMLLDIKMPNVDGMQVMEVLRQKRPDFLVLVITGYATIETAVEAMKSGAYDLLLKPFSVDALRIAVNRALEHLHLAWEMERLRAEQARSLRDIANEQSRIRTIINSMACGILVTDNEKNVVLSNPLGPKMLGIDSASLVGRAIHDVIPQDQLVDMIEQLFPGDHAEYTALEQELQINENLWLRARAAPVRDADNAILGAVTVLQDVTHMKEMEQMKSEFVSMVSHELKAPLAAIQQQLTVLLDGYVGDLNEKQTHFLDRARFRAQGLIDMIDELLDLSRIEAGVVSEQEPLDIAPVIRQVVDFIRPQAEARHQELVCRLGEPLPRISADPKNMDEIFMNLINNAIKYTPENGRIEVTAHTADEYIRVQVKDTGYGIPKDSIPKIFDKFFRVKSDKTRTITGTGLGLPIVQGIVEAHLGSIHVESELGRGTTVTIEFPILEMDAPPSVISS